MIQSRRIAWPVIGLVSLAICLVATPGWTAGKRNDSQRTEEAARVLERLQRDGIQRIVTDSAPVRRFGEHERQGSDIVPDRVVVKLKADFAKRASALPESELPRGLEALDLFLESHGIEKGHHVAKARGKPFTGEKLEAFRRHGMDRLYVMELPNPDEETVLELVEELSRMSWVEYAEPATYGEPMLVPNDTFYSSQWAHNNVGQLPGAVPDADMDTQEAWDLTTGSAAVTLAVADTGALITHPDLVPNLVPNCGNALGSCFDFADNDFDPSHFGDTHGTNTAGIAAARAQNAEGIAGTCQRCQLMVLKECNAAGCTSLAFQDAIVHAANNGAVVISISFCFGFSQAWVDAVNTARDMGTLTVASLGNGTSIQACTPATVPNALAIGGTNRTDARIFAQGTHQFITAPAEGIFSTTFNAGGVATYTSGFGGTSASTPLVAGIIGLINARDSALHVNEVEAVLALGADDQVGPAADDKPGFDISFGHGRANARRSVELVTEEWISIREPQHVCGGPITVGYHNPAGCNGQIATVSGSIGGDSVSVTLNQVTAGGYCEATVNLNWALVDPIDLGDAFLTVEHGETLTAVKNAVSDVSVADCVRNVCHWNGLTQWDFRDLMIGDCDNDGSFDPGHLIRIAPAFANIETEPMRGAVMVLSSDSPYLDFVVNAVGSVDDLPPFTGFTFDPAVDPVFTVRVLPGAPPNSEAIIDISFVSPDGWLGDPDGGCLDFGFTSQITVPLNRDTGAVLQEFDFDDGTAQGWTSPFPHGSGTLSECNNAVWDQNEWLTVPTTDNPHQGTHAMRMGNGVDYGDAIDDVLQSPVLSVPLNGVLGFHTWVDLEPDAPGSTWDGMTVESKPLGAGLWSPMPVSQLGQFNSEPTIASCTQFNNDTFPFGLVEGVPMMTGNGAVASPFGDAYEYEHFVDLAPLAGQDGQVRFRVGADSACCGGAGVWIDTVRMYGGWIADSWPGIGPATVSGSDAGCPTSFDISGAVVAGAAGYNLYKSGTSCADAFISRIAIATSATPAFSDTTVVPEVGSFYAIEAFEGGTTCPSERICIAGGCCSTLPVDPSGLRIDRGGNDVLVQWNEPAVAVTTWFLYHDSDRNPANWGPPRIVDITDQDPATAEIQLFASLPTPPSGSVTYVKVTAVDCGESPLVP